MANEHTPFADNELTALRRFHGICEDIKSCRFIREFNTHDHTITVTKLPDGQSESRFPQYDKDDFLAFLTYYRKLVANKEATNLYSVMALPGRHASTDDRMALKELKQGISSEGNRPLLLISIGRLGQETPYTPKQIENVIFNAQVFHSDEELQEDLKKILDFDPFTKASFLRYAMMVVSASVQIAAVVKKRGYI